jgi:heparin binding hemagglutinin HbhA
MTEEPQGPQGQPSGQGRNSDLVGELRQLGQQLEQLFTTALSSEQARTFQNEVTRGVREIGVQVQHAIKNVQENPRVQELEERGKRAINEARESQYFDRLQDTLVKGLSYLNEQVSTLAERLKTDAPSGTSPASTTQSVPVEDASTPPTTPDDTPPATGDTTRL